MKYWKVDRNKWIDEHPMPEHGYATKEDAQAYCDAVMKVHVDMFRPLQMQNGNWTIEQDVRHA